MPRRSIDRLDTPCESRFSVSPIFSGALLATSFAGLPLLISGSLMIVYDLVLLFSFRHVKPPEEA